MVVRAIVLDAGPIGIIIVGAKNFSPQANPNAHSKPFLNFV